MSIHLISRALREADYSGATQQVLITLCNYADENGHCYPSMLRIAWETGLTERAVRNAIRRLESDGTIVTTGRRGPRNPNEYDIYLENAPRKESWEGYLDKHHGSNKPERRSGIRAETNRNDVPTKPEYDDRKPERRSKQTGTSFRGTVIEPSRTVSDSSARVREEETSLDTIHVKATHQMAAEPEPTSRKRMTYPAAFEDFWAAYPSGRGSKKASFAEWQRIRPDADTISAIMTSLERFKASHQWQTPDYIPHCERWLKQERWTNPPAQPVSAKPTVYFP